MSFALFLDIDGVLNTRTTVVGAPSGRTGVDDARVRILKKALKQFGDVDIILTSDWKLMREDGDDFTYLVSMLKKYGLSLTGKTTDVWVGRGEGIQSYLAEHPEIDEYVILDDNTFDFSNYPKLWERLLLTNGIENAEYASKTPAIEAMLFLEAISFKLGTLLLSQRVSPCHDFIIQGTLFVTKGTSPRRPQLSF